MKIIEVDEELYQFIASQTQSIGESASDILRRLLKLANSRVSSTALDFTSKVNAKTSTRNAIETVAKAQKSVVKKSQKISKKAKKSQSVNQPIQPELISDDMLNREQAEKDLRALLHSPEFQQESKAVSRFLGILSALYQADPDNFSVATESQQLKGRTRIYFAQDQHILLKAGTHTKPKKIPQSPYWVITNNNSGRKMIMLDGVMREMQLSESLINEVRQYFVAN